MKKKFTLFHLSFHPVAQPEFETRSIDRDEWLVYKLTDRVSFRHWGKSVLHWVPHYVSTDLIIGVLQIKRPYSHHLPPEKGGFETVTEEWQGAYVVIDPSVHGTGQRAAVENDVVGQPSSLIRSLVNHINRDPERPYNAFSEQVFDESSFWNFAKRKGGVLRSIRFDFVTPNMWDSRGELERDLQRSREEAGADGVGVHFWSKTGVRTDAPRIVEGVEYSARGEGVIKAKALDGEKFSSLERPATSEVDIPLNIGSVAEFLMALARQILKRRDGAAGGDPDDDGIVG